MKKGLSSKKGKSTLKNKGIVHIGRQSYPLCCCLITKSCLDSFQLMDYRPPRWVRASWKRPTPWIEIQTLVKMSHWMEEKSYGALLVKLLPEIYSLRYQGKLFTGISYQRHPARKPGGGSEEEMLASRCTQGSGAGGTTHTEGAGCGESIFTEISRLWRSHSQHGRWAHGETAFVQEPFKRKSPFLLQCSCRAHCWCQATGKNTVFQEFI